MEDVEKLEMLAGRRWCAQQGIENGAFYVRVCGASASGLRQASCPTNHDWRPCFLSNLKVFTDRNAQGILQNTYS
jgi:hypothetical protein